jgi:hypothetical protein
MFALCGLGVAQMAKDADELKPNGKGWGERATPSGLANGKARPVRGNGISYHGGPVMLNTVPIYYIWYGNWGTDSALNLLPTFITDLSGSGYEHINTTYYDGSNNHVAGTLSFGGNTFVTGGSTSLGDADIKNIVAAHCGDFSGGCKSNAVYFVLTSKEVNETSGFCTQYCGWHTHGSINGLDIKYAFVGNPARCLSSCAAQSTSPNNNAGADGMASIIAHESEEAISDPDLNAWYDTRGEENADKCAWTFGSTSTASNGSKYNFNGANTHYLIQQNWVNASGGYCAMAY